MPRYQVTVRLEEEVTVRLEKEIMLPIQARDPAAAEEKAVEIVQGWPEVTSAEATDVEEE